MDSYGSNACLCVCVCIRLIKCACVYLVLVQLSEVLDSKAWAMTMMLKGARYPSDGDSKLNLITKKLTIKDNVD